MTKELKIPRQESEQQVNSFFHGVNGKSSSIKHEFIRSQNKYFYKANRISIVQLSVVFFPQSNTIINEPNKKQSMVFPFMAHFVCFFCSNPKHFLHFYIAHSQLLHLARFSLILFNVKTDNPALHISRGFFIVLLFLLLPACLRPFSWIVI